MLKIGKSAAPVGAMSRRAEDLFSIKDVIKTLKEVAELERGASSGRSRSVKTTEIMPSAVKTQPLDIEMLKQMIQGYMHENQKGFEATMRKEMETICTQMAVSHSRNLSIQIRDMVSLGLSTTSTAGIVMFIGWVDRKLLVISAGNQVI